MRQQFKILLIAVITLAVAGLIQFVVCTGIAMARFPDGYSFQENFLSELGIQGYPEHWLFNGSMIFLGFSLLPVFGVLWLIDPRRSASGKFTAILGIVSACGIMGTGFWTYDRQFTLHHLSMAAWLLPMLYLAVTFFYTASKSPYVGIGYLGTSLAMVIAMIYVLSVSHSTSLQLLQKTVVICGLIWIGFIVAFIAQSGIAIYRDWQEDDDRKRQKEQSYLSMISSGHRRRS